MKQRIGHCIGVTKACNHLLGKYRAPKEKISMFYWFTHNGKPPTRICRKCLKAIADIITWEEYKELDKMGR